MRDIDKIIIHCSATVEGRDFTAKDIRIWHIRRGFDTIGYGYVICLDGTIEVGRPEERVGAHCKGQNKNSIGICYVGGLDCEGNPKDTRTPKQKESLYKLIFELLKKYNLTIDDVYAHNFFNKYKQCPCFSTQQIRNELNSHYHSDYINT